MSVQPTEKEYVEIPHLGDSAFGALLDALVPAEAGATGDPGADGAGAHAGAGAGAAGAGDNGAAGSSGQPAADGTPAAGAAPIAGAGASGAGNAATGQPGAAAAPGTEGTPAGDPAGTAAVGTNPDLPADWTADSAALLPKFGELSTALEENISKAYQQQAYDQAREDYGNYFDALEKHPRLLVGTQVPAIGKEGMETLRDSNDAKEWQEAVKALLVAEIREQATAKMEESADFMQTVHASIELFQNNPDLIPGTKGFNLELANEFGRMATPYEVRVEGKLQGYSIPVQPIIDMLRQQIVARTAKPLTPPGSSPSSAVPPAVAPAARPAPEPPQAGIQSKASSGAEREDFSTLFGTIGLPNLQI